MSGKELAAIVALAFARASTIRILSSISCAVIAGAASWTFVSSFASFSFSLIVCPSSLTASIKSMMPPFAPGSTIKSTDLTCVILQASRTVCPLMRAGFAKAAASIEKPNNPVMPPSNASRSFTAIAPFGSISSKSAWISAVLSIKRGFANRPIRLRKSFPLPWIWSSSERTRTRTPSNNGAASRKAAGE